MAVRFKFFVLAPVFFCLFQIPADRIIVSNGEFSGFGGFTGFSNIDAERKRTLVSSRLEMMAKTISHSSRQMLKSN